MTIEFWIGLAVIPSLLLGLVLAVILWAASIAAYNATRWTLFLFRVVMDCRHDPRLYNDLDPLYKLPYRLFRSWWRAFISGADNDYVRSKSKVEYRFNGWRKPIKFPLFEE